MAGRWQEESSKATDRSMIEMKKANPFGFGLFNYGFNNNTKEI